MTTRRKSLADAVHVPAAPPASLQDPSAETARARRVIPVDLAAIREVDRIREARPDQVEQIAASISGIGLQSPIMVRPDHGDPGMFLLVAGSHRLTAARQLGWRKIDALVIEVSDDEATLVEIDENLARVELTVLERGRCLARRKHLFKKLHPGSRRGGDRRSEAARAADEDPEQSWSGAARDQTGLSDRAVRRAVRIGEGITTELADVVKGTPIENREGDLYRLSGLDPAEQRELAASIRESGPGAASIEFGNRPRTPDAAPPSAATGLSRLQRAWEAASAAERSEFRNWLRSRDQDGDPS